MAHCKVIDEIFEELVDEMFPKTTDPLYGKFVDQNGVYDFKNGNFIRIDSIAGDKFRGKRAEICVLDDYERIPRELIENALNNLKCVEE